MAGTIRVPRGHARIRQAPGGGDGSFPGDEGHSLPKGASPSRS